MRLARASASARITDAVDLAPHRWRRPAKSAGRRHRIAWADESLDSSGAGRNEIGRLLCVRGVLRTGLQQQHPNRGVYRKTVSQNTSGTSSADDDVIEASVNNVDHVKIMPRGRSLLSDCVYHQMVLGLTLTNERRATALQCGRDATTI